MSLPNVTTLLERGDYVSVKLNIEDGLVDGVTVFSFNARDTTSVVDLFNTYMRGYIGKVPSTWARTRLVNACLRVWSDLDVEVQPDFQEQNGSFVYLVRSKAPPTFQGCLDCGEHQ